MGQLSFAEAERIYRPHKHMHTVNKLPHFIIIGAMKSATSSLQEQLVQQPGIFMCDPKEPNFFSDDEQYAKGMGWYTGLFSAAPNGSLLGEASTHYTKLPTHPHTVARLKEHLPHARFIYVMRHPVDRLISHYIHEWSMGVYHCDIERAVERYPELTTYGQYAMQLEPYFEAFGSDAILPVFFDHLIRYPQMELERICKFIGYSGEPLWVNDCQPSNLSSERIRRFPLYKLVIESEIAAWLRQTLIPKGLRNAVKSRLTMRHRPVLGNDLHVELEAVFDQDLGHLGNFLGTELNCGNFKKVTASKVLSWAAIDGK
ncbi:MAG: sulfotransferase [Candidatus Sedimenticola sp. (ex Thyasira tokunagai)]